MCSRSSSVRSSRRLRRISMILRPERCPVDSPPSACPTDCDSSASSQSSSSLGVMFTASSNRRSTSSLLIALDDVARVVLRARDLRPLLALVADSPLARDLLLDLALGLALGRVPLDPVALLQVACHRTLLRSKLAPCTARAPARLTGD